jgi:hypothetical protein
MIKSNYFITEKKFDKDECSLRLDLPVLQDFAE